MLASHIGSIFSSSSYRNSPLQHFPSAASSLLLLVNFLLIVDWLPQFPVSQRTQPVDFLQGLSFIPSWRHVVCRISSGWRAFWYSLIIGLFVIKLNDVLTTPQLLIGFRTHDDVLVVTPSNTPTQPLADLSHKNLDSLSFSAIESGRNATRQVSIFFFAIVIIGIQHLNLDPADVLMKI